MKLLQLSQIVAVHGDDQIECLEVGTGHPARYARQLVSAAASCGPHSGIGPLPGMEIARSCGIRRDLTGQSSLNDDMFQDPLGGGRAANIPRADEQHRAMDVVSGSEFSQIVHLG